MRCELCALQHGRHLPFEKLKFSPLQIYMQGGDYICAGLIDIQPYKTVISSCAL